MNRRRFLTAAGACMAVSAAPWGRAIRAADAQLPNRKIPGTDERLPIVGLGNSQAFRDGDLDRSRQLLELFASRGGAYVDVSGDSRYVVARVARELGIGDQLFYGTYIEQTSGAADRTDARAVLAAQDKSRLDLVLTRDVAGFSRRREDFQQLKEEGLARYVGVARHREEYHEPMMALMRAGAVDFVQVNYSMLEPEAGERLLPMAGDLGVAVLVNRPFVNGDYFRIVRGHELPGWAAEIGCDTWAKFSLKFILSNPAVTCVLTETANPKHAADNIGAGFGRMPDEATRRRMLGVIRELS